MKKEFGILFVLLFCSFAFAASVSNVAIEDTRTISIPIGEDFRILVESSYYTLNPEFANETFLNLSISRKYYSIYDQPFMLDLDKDEIYDLQFDYVGFEGEEIRLKVSKINISYAEPIVEIIDQPEIVIDSKEAVIDVEVNATINFTIVENDSENLNESEENLESFDYNILIYVFFGVLILFLLTLLIIKLTKPQEESKEKPKEVFNEEFLGAEVEEAPAFSSSKEFSETVDVEKPVEEVEKSENAIDPAKEVVEETNSGEKPKPSKHYILPPIRPHIRKSKLPPEIESSFDEAPAFDIVESKVAQNSAVAKNTKKKVVKKKAKTTKKTTQVTKKSTKTTKKATKKPSKKAVKKKVAKSVKKKTVPAKKSAKGKKTSKRKK